MRKALSVLVLLMVLVGCSDPTPPAPVAMPSASIYGDMSAAEVDGVNKALGQTDPRDRMESIWPSTIANAKRNGSTSRVQPYNKIPVRMSMNLASEATEWSFFEATFAKHPDLPVETGEVILAQFTADLGWGGLPFLGAELLSKTESDITQWRWERNELDGQYIRRIHFRLKSKTEPIAAQAKRAESKGTLSQDELSNLFIATWLADDDETLAYKDNVGVDDLEGKSWQWCIQWKAEGFFKDAGFAIKLSTLDKYVIHELDYKSDLSNQLRIIDENSFAYLPDGSSLWIVFSKIE